MKSRQALLTKANVRTTLAYLQNFDDKIVFMQTTDNHEEMKEMLEENNKLLEENNKYLKRLYRNAKWSFWIRIVWYLLLLGLPFAIYFYILEPYFTLLGSSYEQFNAGIHEIPGWKQFNLLMDHFSGKSN